MSRNDDYDYTDEQAQAVSAEDFVIEAPVAATRSAEEIEAENSFEDIPPGTHRLVVVGFLSPPEAKRKDLYLGRQRVAINTYSVVVKFALPDERNKQVTDYFLLPPADPDQYAAYCQGSKEPDGKTKGFFAGKYDHFIQRLFGIVVPKGQPHPNATRRLGNWKGREVIATVKAGKPFEKKKVDTDNGEVKTEERPGRNEIALYSYRAADDAAANYQRPAARAANGNGTTTTAHAVQPSPRAAAPAADPKAVQLASLKAAYTAAIEAEDFDEAKTIKAAMAKLQGGAAPAPQPRPASHRQPAMAGAGVADDRGLADL